MDIGRFANRDAFIESHRVAIQTSKEIIVAAARGNQDMIPRSMVWFDNGTCWGGVPGMLCMMGFPAPYVQMVAGAKATMIRIEKERGEKVRPIGFICAMEGYIIQHNADDPVLDEPRDPRSLQERFEQDPDSNVLQTVSSYFVQDDGMGGVDFWSINTPYRIGDGGVVEWIADAEVIDTESDHDKRSGGELPLTLINLIKEYQG